MLYFGQPWPSNVCEEGECIATPTGVPCQLCDVAIVEGDRGVLMGPGAMHRECIMRAAWGGIGHLRDHRHWCVEMNDPDGGLSYRESACEVWTFAEKSGDLDTFWYPGPPSPWLRIVNGD